MEGLFELEDQATDLEVFEAAGVNGEGKSSYSGCGSFPPASSTHARRFLGVGSSLGEPLARVVLQNHSSSFSKVHVLAPLLSGEEPRLVYLTKSFLL